MLAVIPARAASRAIPRKNLKSFAGKPLVAWTIETALAADSLARLVLSTEDEEIATIGRDYGAEVPFLRPEELAADTTPTAAVVRHALDWLRASQGWHDELVMVLEPTSPARRARHIEEAAELLARTGAESLASISRVPHHYVPSKILVLDGASRIGGYDGTPVRRMVHRRQELPACYALNGLVYACRSELVLRDPPTLWGDDVVGYVVEPRYALDLDEPEDWAPAEMRLREILAEEAV